MKNHYFYSALLKNYLFLWNVSWNKSISSLTRCWFFASVLRPVRWPRWTTTGALQLLKKQLVFKLDSRSNFLWGNWHVCPICQQVRTRAEAECSGGCLHKQPNSIRWCLCQPMLIYWIHTRCLGVWTVLGRARWKVDTCLSNPLRQQ